MINTLNYLQEQKLDYQIVKHPLLNDLTGEREKTKFGIYNNENKIMLSTVSDHYEIIQNDELFPLIFESFNNIKEIQKFSLGASFNNGAKVLVSANLGFFDLPNGDRIEKNLSVLTNHDGKGSIHSFVNPYRIFCKNQLNKITTKFEFTFKVRHSRNKLEIIGNLENYISMVDNEFRLIENTFLSMTKKKVSKNQIIKIISSLFTEKNEKNDTKKGNTMINSQIENIINRFNNPKEIIEDKNSQWNLYNSIQGTLQHDPKRNGSNHLLNVMNGSVSNQSEDILNDILNLSDNDNWENDLINNEISELIGDLINV